MAVLGRMVVHSVGIAGPLGNGPADLAAGQRQRVPRPPPRTRHRDPSAVHTERRCSPATVAEPAGADLSPNVPLTSGSAATACHRRRARPSRRSRTDCPAATDARGSCSVAGFQLSGT